MTRGGVVRGRIDVVSVRRMYFTPLLQFKRYFIIMDTSNNTMIVDTCPRRKEKPNSFLGIVYFLHKESFRSFFFSSRKLSHDAKRCLTENRKSPALNRLGLFKTGCIG